MFMIIQYMTYGYKEKMIFVYECERYESYHISLNFSRLKVDISRQLRKTWHILHTNSISNCLLFYTNGSLPLSYRGALWKGKYSSRHPRSTQDGKRTSSGLENVGLERPYRMTDCPTAFHWFTTHLFSSHGVAGSTKNVFRTISIASQRC